MLNSQKNRHGKNDMNTLSMEGLDALFDIEFADSNPVAGPILSPNQIVCHKCKGRGNFIGYSGKVIGKCFACDGTGLSKAVIGQDDGSTAIDVTKITAAFERAHGKGLKRPKVTFKSIQFSRAPDSGKNPGAIYVKDGEEYLGKVLAGRFYPVKACDEARRAEIVTIAADPGAAAKAHGLKVGWCSCCGRELTDPNSIALGIGPICQERFGF
jgi:hypothetical protein